MKQTSLHGVSSKLILKLEDKINLAAKCIYKNNSVSREQIELSRRILEFLPEL